MNAQQTDCNAATYGSSASVDTAARYKTSEAFRVTVLYVVCIFLFAFTFLASEFVHQLKMQEKFRKPQAEQRLRIDSLDRSAT